MRNRPGFTAIEILIVVAIIALLMSIAAGALIRVRAASERTATETTLTKLASILDRHWKAVIDAAKKEYDGLPTSIKQNLVALADNTTASATTPKPHPRRDDRARLLYVKFRLKQEFPTSFYDAIYPATLKPPQIPANTAFPTNQPLHFLPPQTIPGWNPLTNTAEPVTGKPAYVKFLVDFYKNPAISSQGISPNNIGIFPSPKYQAAILLALALEQSRSGIAPANLEQEVGTSFIPSGFEDTQA